MMSHPDVKYPYGRIRRSLTSVDPDDLVLVLGSTVRFIRRVVRGDARSAAARAARRPLTCVKNTYRKKGK